MYEGCTTYKGNNGSREWFGYKLGLKENIYEQFAYLYNLVGYPNSSNIPSYMTLGSA